MKPIAKAKVSNLLTDIDLTPLNTLLPVSQQEPCQPRKTAEIRQFLFLRPLPGRNGPARNRANLSARGLACGAIVRYRTHDRVGE
jgi:hypothetical protein